MTQPTDRSGPQTQRVPSGTRGAAVAALIAISVIALLVAKPWDRSVPSSTQPARASAPVADAPAQPSIVGPSASASLGTTRTSDTGAIYSLEIGNAGDVARCLYDERRGRRWLSAVLVLPPRAFVPSDAGSGRTRNVGWRVELEHNHQQSLFSEAWTPTVESRLQVVTATNGQPAPFLPMEVQIDAKPLGKTGIVRARLIVDWYSPRLSEFFRSEFVVPTYVVGGRATGPALSSCPSLVHEPF